jgi:hypothetical protein
MGPPMEIVVVVTLMFVLIFSISRFGKVQSVSPEGISIRTIFGRPVAVRWDDVRSPIRISRVLGTPIIEIRRANARFLSAQSKVSAWLPKTISYEALREVMPTTVKISDWQ